MNTPSAPTVSREATPASSGSNEREALPADLTALLLQAVEALTEIGAMYAHTWDRVDGALWMMPQSIPRFEAAHAKVQEAATALRQRIGRD